MNYTKSLLESTDPVWIEMLQTHWKLTEPAVLIPFMDKAISFAIKNKDLAKIVEISFIRDILKYKQYNG